MFRKRAVLVFAALFFAACVSKCRGQSIRPSATAGTITVQTPAPIVRATVPLARGFEWDPRASPVSLVTSAGVRCPTQWEAVTRWPGTKDVRVAEILAVVPPGSGAQSYTLQVDSQADGRTVAPSWAKAWLDTDPEFLVDGQPIVTTRAGVNVRSGKVATTVRFYGPHLVGWMTVYAALDVVEMTVIAHNGQPRSPPWTFSSLELVGPTGFESFAPEPLVAMQGGRLVLVPPRPDGAPNWIEQRGWRRWHLVLHHGDAATARAIADGAGWGVADGWWRIGAYQPHALPLPILPPARIGQLGTKCRSDWASIRDALTNGTPFGMGANLTDGAGRIGFRHAWGQFYGGVTSGTYREQWHGLPALYSGAPEGLLELDARFRMIADRQPVISCDAHGAPQRIEAWLDTAGKPKGAWRASAADERFDDDGGALGLGWSALAPSVLTPDMALLKKYAPIDWQHHDRAHQVAVALAWLANDPSAKWAIAQYAENWRWREYGRLGSALAKARNAPAMGCDYGREAGHGYSIAAAAYALGADPWRARWTPIFRDYVETLATAQMGNGLFQERGYRKEAKAAPFGNGTTANYSISKGTEEALLSGSLAAIRGVAGESTVTCEELGHDADPTHAHTLCDAIDPTVTRHAVQGLWWFLWNSGATGPAPTNYVSVRTINGPVMADPAAAIRSGADSEEISAALGYAAWVQIERTGAITTELSAAISRYCGASPTPPKWLDAQTLVKYRIDDVAPLQSALQWKP